LAGKFAFSTYRFLSALDVRVANYTLIIRRVSNETGVSSGKFPHLRLQGGRTCLRQEIGGMDRNTKEVKEWL
jgi:hypothetical protein